MTDTRVLSVLEKLVRDAEHTRYWAYETLYAAEKRLRELQLALSLSQRDHGMQATNEKAV